MAVPSLRGPIKVADLTAELIDAVQIRRGDEMVTLRGYVSGRRCTGRVKAAAADAIRRNPSTGPDGNFDYGSHLAQLRDLLCAVVVGIEEDEADMLAGDPGAEGAVAILHLLGWWSQPPADDEDADPNPEAASLTTDDSTPSLPPSTDSAGTTS